MKPRWYLTIHIEADPEMTFDLASRLEWIAKQIKAGHECGSGSTKDDVYAFKLSDKPGHQIGSKEAA